MALSRLRLDSPSGFMLDHDSRDAFAFGILQGGRVEAPHLALGAVNGEDPHRPRVAALHPEREPPVQRGPR